jgi:hypothetical protein
MRSSGTASGIPKFGVVAPIFALMALPALNHGVQGSAQNGSSDPPAVKHATSQASGPVSVPTGSARDDATVRNDELTLAGLRPGRDALTKAEHLFSKPVSRGDSGTVWRDGCRHEALSIFTDSDGTIVQVTVAEAALDAKHECASSGAGPGPWITGHGLVIGDSSARVLALYGQPGTRGPSTKGGQQLELFYYAFDWAGPDVPQVMTVLCTPDGDGKLGRVVEITLAAPSL